MTDTIIYYGGFALPDKNAAANRVVSNGKIFETLGYNVVFLGSDYENGSFSGVKALSGNMFSEAHPAGVTQWLKQILLFKNLKKLVGEYKNIRLVILYNVPFVTLCLVKSFLKKRHIEVAYDCTEWTQFTEGSFIKKLFKYIDEFFVRRFTHKVVKRVIVISKMMEQAYKKNTRVLKLPPLVDLTDEIWHQKTEKDKDRFVFCFAGFPGGNKENLDKVAEAFLKLDDKKTVLKIAGLEQEQFCAMYPYIELSQNIEFLGKLSHRESIRQILSGDCYVFVRPSDRRNNAGFPTKFAESFTCGSTIITTDVSDIKEYAKKTDRCIVLDTTDSEVLCNAMKKVMQEIHSQNKKVLRRDFDYKNYIDDTRFWLN